MMRKLFKIAHYLFSTPDEPLFENAPMALRPSSTTPLSALPRLLLDPASAPRPVKPDCLLTRLPESQQQIILSHITTLLFDIPCRAIRQNLSETKEDYWTVQSDSYQTFYASYLPPSAKAKKLIAQSLCLNVTMVEDRVERVARSPRDFHIVYQRMLIAIPDLAQFESNLKYFLSHDCKDLISLNLNRKLAAPFCEDVPTQIKEHYQKKNNLRFFLNNYAESYSKEEKSKLTLTLPDAIHQIIPVVQDYLAELLPPPQSPSNSEIYAVTLTGPQT